MKIEKEIHITFEAVDSKVTLAEINSFVVITQSFV